MRDRLRAGLKDAMKSRDRVAASALRSALAAIDNAEATPLDEDSRASAVTTGTEHVAGAAAGVGAAETARRELTEADVLAVVRGEIEERTRAAEEYEGLGRADEADRLRTEASVLASHLP